MTFTTFIKLFNVQKTIQIKKTQIITQIKIKIEIMMNDKIKINQINDRNTMRAFAMFLLKTF